MGKNAQGGKNTERNQRGKSAGAAGKKNGNNNEGRTEGENILPLQQERKSDGAVNDASELKRDGQNPERAAGSHLTTQADSQLRASQGLGRGPLSVDVASVALSSARRERQGARHTTAAGSEHTPATAFESNLSPITQKNWQKPGAHLDIEEEARQESKAEDEVECSQRVNYRLDQGRLYTGGMRPNPSNSGENKYIPHGAGAMTMEDGSRIEGIWKDSRALEGLKTYPNGDRYEGRFNNNLPNGYGILRQPDGVTFEGNWLNGSIVDGTEVNPEGEVYTGQFHNRQRHGIGQCSVNGNPIKQGKWELGQLVEGTGEIRGQREYEGNNFIGQSDLDGQNAKLRFGNNQELTEEEKLQRQKEMIDYVRNNENAVEQALDAHAQAVDDLAASFQPPSLLPEKSGYVPAGGYQGSSLREAAAGYRASYDRQRQEYADDRWSLETLRKELYENPVLCTKYNYTLDKVLMNHLQFDCRLEISEDGRSLILRNRKMATAPRYDYEQTPDDIVAEEKARKEAARKGEQYEVAAKEEEFSYHQSSSSCSLSDIEGMIVGGHSSRFWIYRKHMISLDYDVMKFDSQAPGVKTSFPFFSWQCLTLVFSTRTVDLVIKDDRKMDVLVRFLVQALNTIDGRSGSANFYIEAAIINEIARREKRLNKRRRAIRSKILEAGPLASDEEFDEPLQLLKISDEEKAQIRYEQTKEINRQTMFKYTLMRIRAKIGYHAFQKRMTVNELILTQVLRSYNELTQTNQIPPIASYTPEYIHQFENLLKAPTSSTLPLLQEMAQDPALIERKKFIFKKRELMKFGVRYDHELTLEQREEYQEILDKNIGDDVQQRIEEKLTLGGKRLSVPGQSQKVVEQDELKSMAKINRFSNGFGLFDKSKCMDIYKTVQVDGLNMYELRSICVMIKFKLDKKIIEQQLTKIRFMLGVGDLIDIFFIKAILIKKALLKKQFVLDVEHNLECYIPHELSLDMYPYSFRYYDPIIQITNQLFSQKQKLYHCLKTDFYLKKIKGKDFKKKFLEDFGFIETEKNRKQTFKHRLQAKHEEQDIKHSQSKHHISLQRSRYLMVESTEEGLRNLADLQTYVIEKKWEKGPHEKEKNLEDLPLELKFCHQGVVNSKRNKFIIFKQSQYTHLDHMKNQGQKFNTMRLIQREIRKNFDEYYANRPRDENYNPGALEKDLDLIPYNELSDRQKSLLDQDKVVYLDWLMSQGEKVLMRRRNRIRIKTIDQTYFECDKSIPYETRNNWIENRIELRFKYFEAADDISGSGSEMEQIRRKLMKNSALLKNRSQTNSRLQSGITNSKRGETETFSPMFRPKQKQLTTIQEFKIAVPDVEELQKREIIEG